MGINCGSLEESEGSEKRNYLSRVMLQEHITAIGRQPELIRCHLCLNRRVDRECRGQAKVNFDYDFESGVIHEHVTREALTKIVFAMTSEV
jgi:hypothetical protein